MKKIIYAIATIFIVGMMWGSCIDDFEKVNENRDKLYSADIQIIFPGTVYRTMNVFGEMNYTKFLNYSRSAKVAFTEIEVDAGASYARQFYVDILRDLLSLERQYEGKADLNNRLMIIKTWKAFIFSTITAMWGPAPMSDAMMTDLDKLVYKYDSEKDIYVQVLDLLKTASEGFNPVTPLKDYLNPDPVFGGNSVANIEKWRKFANTLRLEIALRAENVDPTLAELHIKEAMSHEDWFIASTADMVAPTWGNDASNDVSYYYRRFLQSLTPTNLSESTYPRIGQYMFTYLQSYYDPRLEKYADKPTYNYRLEIRDTIDIIRKSDFSGLDTTLHVVSRHSVPYAPAQETPSVPKGWTVAYDPNSNNGQGTQQYQNPYGGIPKEGWAYVNISFIQQNAKVVFLNQATAEFLKAEAKLKYGVGSKTVEQYYEDGVAASFNQYDISGTELAKYMARDGIKWGTAGKGMCDYMQIWYADIDGEPLEQIIKQRWIAEYFNGFSQWVTERRTRILNLPPLFYNGQPSIDGSNSRYDYPPERLVWPISEQSTNDDEYRKAIQILQAASPKGDNVNRWGDNLWTNLQFVKLNPALQDPNNEAKWTGRSIVYNQNALQNRYGKTEEEMIKIAQQEFPQVTDTTGLRIYLKYSIEEIIGPRP